MITPAAASALCSKAAARARQLAEAAAVTAPPPWRAEKGGWHGDWPLEYVANSGGRRRFKAPSEAESAHIAAWHPLVTLAVANMWEIAGMLIGALTAGDELPMSLSVAACAAEAFLGGAS